MDIAGPFLKFHVHGFGYILVLIDDHSRFKSIFFLKHKSDAITKFKEYVAALRSSAAARAPASP